MDAPFDEGIKKQNDLPLSVQCLIMPLTTMLPKWGRLHYHDYIELLYTVKGNVSVNVCGKEYLMTENTAVIINSGELHGRGWRQNAALYQIFATGAVFLGTDCHRA